MAVVVAESAGVCVRPYVKSVTDVVTGVATAVPIPYGSTREFVCLSCAVKARRLRMHQCRDGWHRTTDLEDDHMAEIGDDEMGDDEGDEVGHGEGVDDGAKASGEQAVAAGRRVRSTPPGRFPGSAGGADGGPDHGSHVRGPC